MAAEGALPRDAAGSTTRRPRRSSCRPAASSRSRAARYQQIAMASRSLHRSQGHGPRSRSPGRSETRVGMGRRRRRAGGQGPLRGRSTRGSPAIAAEVPDSARRAEIGDGISTASRTWPRRRAGALSTAGPLRDRAGARRRPSASCARRARWSRPGDGGAAMLLDEKIALAQAALAAAAGVTLDVLAERETAAARRERRRDRQRLERRSARRRRRERRPRVSPDGLGRRPAPDAGPHLGAGSSRSGRRTPPCPPDAPPTLPYFLTRR